MWWRPRPDLARCGGGCVVWGCAVWWRVVRSSGVSEASASSRVRAGRPARTPQADRSVAGLLRLRLGCVEWSASSGVIRHTGVGGRVPGRPGWDVVDEDGGPGAPRTAADRRPPGSPPPLLAAAGVATTVASAWMANLTRIASTIRQSPPRSLDEGATGATALPPSSPIPLKRSSPTSAHTEHHGDVPTQACRTVRATRG